MAHAVGANGSTAGSLAYAIGTHGSAAGAFARAVGANGGAARAHAGAVRARAGAGEAAFRAAVGIVGIRGAFVPVVAAVAGGIHVVEVGAECVTHVFGEGDLDGHRGVVVAEAFELEGHLRNGFGRRESYVVVFAVGELAAQGFQVGGGAGVAEAHGAHEHAAFAAFGVRRDAQAGHGFADGVLIAIVVEEVEGDPFAARAAGDAHEAAVVENAAVAGRFRRALADVEVGVGRFRRVRRESGGAGQEKSTEQRTHGASKGCAAFTEKLWNVDGAFRRGCPLPGFAAIFPSIIGESMLYALLALGLLSATPAFAAEKAEKAADKKSGPATEATLEKLFTITEVQKNMQSAASAMSGMMNERLASRIPNDDRKQRFFADLKDLQDDFMKTALNFDELRPSLVKTYQETWTEDEIQQLVKFYESPVGKKYVQVMPDLMQKGMKLAQGQVQKYAPDFGKKVQALVAKTYPELAKKP